jgi:hypothetical protein
MDAELISRRWRQVDLKLVVDGELHMLRWRRRTFHDEVLFDDRRVASAQGLFNRDATFGLEVKTATGVERMLFTVDSAPGDADWNGTMRPRGVRLESKDRVLVGVGSLKQKKSGPGAASAWERVFADLGLDSLLSGGRR